MNNQNKRERLIDSAAILFHHRGMNATSLADIAKHADIPIGNVYYYFKTKEELALAALTRRKEQFTAIYKSLQDNLGDPRQRLIELTRYYDTLREEYTKHGCPIGKMIEGAEAEADNVTQAAAQTLADFVDWSEQQFRQLGHTEQARNYAISLVSGIQGAVTVAKAYGKSSIISDELARLAAWLESLPNRRIPLGKAGMRASAETAGAA